MVRLDEETRIIAGLQESMNVENPLPKLIESERKKALTERQRIINEQKTVLTHFDVFKEKMERFQSMVSVVSTLLENKHSKEFIGGLVESKYGQLQKFADVIINDDFAVSMTYLEEHYYSIKEELDKIQLINETDDEEGAPNFFVSEPLITNDPSHKLNVPVFKLRTLEEKVSNEIPYGSELIHVSENLTIVRHSGKKFYTRFTSDQIELLEKKGFLI